MKSPPPVAVAFREVRHFRPEDCIHCEAIEVRGHLHDWTIPAHRHSGLHQFQLLQRGAVRVVLDQLPHRVESPGVIVIAPGCVHAFEYDPGSAGIQVTVPSAMLSEAFAAAPALAEGLGASRIVDGAALASSGEDIGAMFTRLAAEFDGASPGRTEALRAHVALLAVWLLRRNHDQNAAGAPAALRDTLVQRFRALLEIHLRQHRPLGFYAEALHVTPDHLSRACRGVMGLSALELMHDRMVLEARRLLAYTNAQVGEIAAELGFADPAYFSRFFARRAGGSPQAYRAALQQGTAAQP